MLDPARVCYWDERHPAAAPQTIVACERWLGSTVNVYINAQRPFWLETVRDNNAQWILRIAEDFLKTTLVQAHTCANMCAFVHAQRQTLI